MLTSREIRQQFIDFFVERCGHTFVPSSAVVPHDDPSLLFTNAGMNQFKDVFLGLGHRDYQRACNSQKCIRAGGKHNDLDDVGKDTYHHTFFEMLGNWSFGDYFKAEAIDWAWELLTEVYGLEPKRLYATYFGGDEQLGLDPDDEAKKLWTRHLPEDRILPGSMADNFWEMGDTGPCGPCSEIHYDRTPDAGGRDLVNADSPDVIEVWNLVFIQFNRAADGKLTNLPARHVDTGMGFERLVAILQGKTSNYDTDVFTPLFEAIRQITGAPKYTGDLRKPEDVAYRVIADHARCLTFAVTDGATPGNEGRDYVLRRILRRGVRYGRQTLGMTEPFLYRLVPTVVDLMGEAFAELREDPQRVADVIKEEEESFGRTLDRGIELFEEAAESAARAASAQEQAGVAATPTISADDAFRLYDTHGFPLDLTQLMAEERGMEVNVAGFEDLMEQQRRRARAAGGGGDERDSLRQYVQQQAPTATEFLGYDQLIVEQARPIATLALRHGVYEPVEQLDKDESAALVVDRTPFYAEAGGQVGDTGYIRSREGAVFRVEDTIKFGDVWFHLGRLEAGSVRTNEPAFGPEDQIILEVDRDRRAKIRANHTATHVLNHKLRRVLGDHVQQKGSLVDEHKTRFDFSHGQSVGVDDVERIERMANDDIDADLPVYTRFAPQEEAREIYGLRAVFGEKYPPVVRVVSIGPDLDEVLEQKDNPDWANYSIEFCGGTHLSRTGEARRFCLVSEEAVAKGIRRLTGVTGEPAQQAVDAAQAMNEWADSLEGQDPETLARSLGELSDRLAERQLPLVARARLRERIEKLQKLVKQHEKQASKEAAGEVVEQARAVADQADGKLIVAEIEGADGKTLRTAMDVIRKLKPEAALLLGAVSGGKIAFVAAVPEELIEQGLKAGDWVREVAQVAGGGGGGRPDMAQAGGKDPDKLDDALEAGRTFAREQLGEHV